MHKIMLITTLYDILICIMVICMLSNSHKIGWYENKIKLTQVFPFYKGPVVVITEILDWWTPSCDKGYPETVDVLEWMRNYAPHVIMDVIIYPCYD